MRVFVTGATGFVGSAVVRELIANNHEVIGLSRSDAGAQELTDWGVKVLRGSLQDHDCLRAGADAADAVLHLAFNHDFSRFAQNCEDDRQAIMAMGSALEGSDRPLIVTSGLALIASGDVATEEDKPAADFPRGSETAALALSARGIRTASVRLAPSTHGEGDHGFVPHLINLARETGVSAYVGDGLNRWPGVHRLDAARLYRLALEQGVEASVYHAVDEEGVPFRAIAELIGQRLGLPVVSKLHEDAEAHFGWFTLFAGMDVPASSNRTRATLNWEPRQPGLLADLDQTYYFEA